ncbi:hypothetical protein LSAT2_027517, partial [Lamellibrachia satsuma]
VFAGAAVVTFFLICVFTARSIWIVGVFKTSDSVVGHEAWKGMFVDPLNPDKSDCRALFARPASDDDFYPTSYIEHRGNFERELSRVHGEGFVMGHSGGSDPQSRFYYWLAGRPWVKTVCETGFNAGHSTLQWLTGSDDTIVYSFDIGSFKYTRPMADYLNKTFPGRLHLVIGDSLETLPHFSDSNLDVK